MRAVVAAMFAVGCAAAGAPRVGGEDAPDGGSDGSSLPACDDDDGDSVCNDVDKCAGHDDAIDADTDTVADGCDRCPTEDDSIDENANAVADCSEYQTRTIGLKSVDGNLWRGWHASQGDHSSGNDNTLTGLLMSVTHNSYFVFPLTGFTAHSVKEVTLQLQLEAYDADASETFTVWDVTTPSATVENTQRDLAIYTDLMTGTAYGTGTATAGQLNQLLSVPLNAMAARDATAKLGQDFVVGVHVDTAPGWIRFGQAAQAPPTTLQIVVKYLP